MTDLGVFPWTTRAYPIVELGLGDVRISVPGGLWDTARWDTAGDTWGATEPTWTDITCDTMSYRCEYGRQRTTEQFVVGTATVVVRNTTGWADPAHSPDVNDTTVRPGRAIRMGVVHQVHGIRWLFRGFIDGMNPTYDATEADTVELSCVDALGEVNRAKFVAFPDPVGLNETVDARINRVLDLAKWPTSKRDLAPAADPLAADDMDGQAADLISQAADSAGGSVYADTEANICYRPRDWQTYTPGTPVDGTIGNIVDTTKNRVTFGEFNYLWFGDQVIEGESTGASDVCPIRWERPFNRADITTRVIVANESATVQLDDPAGQQLYGIEPFEQTDLITASYDLLVTLAERLVRTRGPSTSPRVRSVSLDARTADNALDLMTTVDVHKPSRYRCRLEYPRGTVFDGEYFATAVSHEVTPDAWTLELNLDNAAPFAQVGSRWDTGLWDTTGLWAISV